jgi:hypothetical protein
MEFTEQPLSYEEARRGVANFEHKYKLRSADVFSGRMEPDACVSPDALFEWKSYYDFVCEVDQTLSAALAGNPVLEEVIYASGSASEPYPRSAEDRKQAALKIAA